MQCKKVPQTAQSHSATADAPHATETSQQILSLGGGAARAWELHVCSASGTGLALIETSLLDVEQRANGSRACAVSGARASHLWGAHAVAGRHEGVHRAGALDEAVREHCGLRLQVQLLQNLHRSIYSSMPIQGTSSLLNLAHAALR